MKSFTNHMAGARGVNTKGGGTIWIEPGQTVEIDPATIEGRLPDFGKASATGDSSGDADLLARVETLEAENADLRAKLAALDGDSDGAPGGSKPADPPALTGKNKAELLTIAKAEGVEIEEGATNEDIRSAIELHREG